MGWKRFKGNDGCDTQSVEEAARPLSNFSLLFDLKAILCTMSQAREDRTSYVRGLGQDSVGCAAFLVTLGAEVLY